MSASPLTCPFCGLCCDDLSISDEHVDTRGCAKSAHGFGRAGLTPKPHTVDGVPVSFGEAVTAAADLLRRAEMPLFCGLAADVHGVREMLSLADRVGGVIDHKNSQALLANAAVARASGWVVATFGEIANRADFVLIVGADPARNFPRFHDRLLANRAPLYRIGPPAVAYLGPAEDAPAIAASRIDVPPHDMLNALGMLAAALRRTKRLAIEPPFAALAERLLAARYSALVWDVTSFDPERAELAVERIAAILRQLNLTTRCVGLPLGGSENGMGAMQVCLWQTGWPLRVRLGAGAVRHDPWQFDGRRLLSAAETDLVVWVGALSPEPPPVGMQPLIALIADDVELPLPAAVEIRVGIPAIDHTGEIMRSDSVIALPLKAAHETDKPSVAAAARAILAQFGSTA